MALWKNTYTPRTSLNAADRMLVQGDSGGTDSTRVDNLCYKASDGRFKTTAALDVGGSITTTSMVSATAQVGASGYAARSTGTWADLYVNASRGGVQAFNFTSSAFVPFDMNASEVTVNCVFRPTTDNNRTLGSASFRWSTVYAGTGTINTSDEREKTEIGAIPNEWLDAWGDVEWSRFRFKDGSRWHVGMVAQRVHAAFAAHGLDAFEIGLCCYDEWEDQFAPEMEGYRLSKVIGPDGEPKMVKARKGEKPVGFRPTGKMVLAMPAGDRWGLRYDECFAIEAAWQRREIARMQADLAELKAKP